MLTNKQIAYFVLAETHNSGTESNFWQYLGYYSPELGVAYRDVAAWASPYSEDSVARFLCWLRGEVFGLASADCCDHDLQKCEIPGGDLVIEVCQRCGGISETVQDETHEYATLVV